MYAQIFTTLWSCLCFSSGLPILYPVACVSYFVLYWVYKVLLLKYYAKTTEFDEDLPVRSIEYMKYGILFHMIVGSFMFTNSAILAPAEDIEQITNLTDMVQDNEAFQWFTDRFLLSAHAQIYLAVLLLGIVLFCLWTVLGAVLARLCDVLTCSCLRSQAVALEDKSLSHRQFSSACIYKELNIGSFADFYRRAVRQLTDFQNGKKDKTITADLLPGEAMFESERLLQGRVDRM